MRIILRIALPIALSLRRTVKSPVTGLGSNDREMSVNDLICLLSSICDIKKEGLSAPLFSLGFSEFEFQLLILELY